MIVSSVKQKFQFLIGKLITSITNSLYVPFLAFQFLIGKLITKGWLDADAMDELVFQFLIGKLITTISGAYTKTLSGFNSL